jgi:O-antigen ligase
MQVLRRLFETAFLAVGIFLSFQRNYWITMLLMVGLLFLLVNWAERVRGLQWMTVGVVVLMVMAAIPGVGLNNYIVAAQDRLFRGMQVDTLVEDKSAQMRVMETEYALETVLARPVFGIGMGNVYRPWMPDDAYFRPEAPRLGLRWYAHNAYLWLWVMAGAVGLVPFLILYGLFIWRGLRYWRHMKGSVGGLGQKGLGAGNDLGHSGSDDH